MLVNISFNNVNIKLIKELYLYYRLRSFAESYGGYFTEMPLSRNEVERLLPTLHNLGWVDRKKMKVISYRKVVSNTLNKSTKHNRFYAQMDDSALCTMDTFKAFLLSSCEANILKTNLKKIRKARKNKNLKKRDWIKSGSYSSVNDDFFVKSLKISDFNKFTIQGKIYISTITRVLGVSESTIKRWRKYNKFNNYLTSKVSAGKTFVSDPSKFHYCRATNSFVTNEVFVQTNIKTFFLKW